MNVKIASLCTRHSSWLQPSSQVRQTYVITDLGVLKGDNESSGFWINNYGEVAGCSDTQTSYGYPCTGLVAGQHAFYWSKATGMKDLGTLSATVSGAIGLNDAGTVVGYSNVKGQLATKSARSPGTAARTATTTPSC